MCCKQRAPQKLMQHTVVELKLDQVGFDIGSWECRLADSLMTLQARVICSIDS